MKKIGVFLSGCGHQDGSEVQESVFAMLGLQSRGAQLQFFSLDEAQTYTKNHLSGNLETNAPRNMMLESARISRGNIVSASHFNVNDIAAIVFPGGFGCASNFCDFSTQQKKMKVNHFIERAIKKTHEMKKPIAAICIAPILVAKVLGDKKVLLTTGEKSDVSECIESWGARHQLCPKSECVVDHDNKIISTPAYMYSDSSIEQVYQGIDKLTKEIMNMI
jgi:enhancing lycopene biosynthesis protein 2